MKHCLNAAGLHEGVTPLDQWLTQKTLCAMLDVSERTLERMRAEGNGPRFSKAGKRVLYRAADVEAWLAERSFVSTAEARFITSR